MKINLTGEAGISHNITNHGGFTAFYRVTMGDGSSVRFLVQPGASFEVISGTGRYDIDVDVVDTVGLSGVCRDDKR